MERRFLTNEWSRVTIESRTAEGKQSSVIVGYGAVFYDGTPETEYVLWDDAYGRAVERILPGAFDGALSRPDDCRGLFNHDPNFVLGRTVPGTMTLAIDATGLRYEIAAPDTQAARDVIAYIGRRDVTGSSFSFSAPPLAAGIAWQKWEMGTDSQGREIDVRSILAVKLWDVGPVTFPAYDGTSSELRGQGSGNRDQAEARASHEAWRKALASEHRGVTAGELLRQRVQARARAVEVDAVHL